MICEIGPDVNKAGNHAMLCKRLSKAMKCIAKNAESSKIALRSDVIRRGGLLNGIDGQATGGAAKIFRTLKSGVRRNDAKMRTDNFRIARTAPGVTLKKFFELGRPDEGY